MGRAGADTGGSWLAAAFVLRPGGPSLHYFIPGGVSTVLGLQVEIVLL